MSTTVKSVVYFFPDSFFFILHAYYSESKSPVTSMLLSSNLPFLSSYVTF